MGEFGFITADDVYHVTVYATDENGHFKIVSMKNIKLMKGPAPQAFAPKSAPPVTTTVKPFMVKTTVKSVSPSPPSGEPACASCRLPSKPADSELIKPSSSPIDDPTDVPPPFKVVGKDDPITTEAPTTSLVDVLPQKYVNANSGSVGARPGSLNGNIINQHLKNGNDNRGLLNDRTFTGSSFGASPGSRQQAINEKPNSPQFFNKNGGSVDHYNKMENLMNGLLYRFDYNTDYQGHREEGDRLGNKDGEYYSVGRDNIKRVVSYKANEFGYMPFIRQEPLRQQQLQQLDERNNKLRNYKFEWFYP